MVDPRGAPYLFGMRPEPMPLPFDAAFCLQVLEASSEGIVVVGARGDLAANPAARELCGADIERVLAQARAGRAGQVGGAVEVRVHDAHGRARWIAVEARSVEHLEVFFLRDVTRRRALEDELKQSMKTESIGFVTASVVHDFNNLLTPILCLSSALAEQLDGSPRGLAQQIRAAAERAAGLVRRLLAFARRTPGPPERVNLGDLVIEMWALVANVLGEEIELSVSIDPALGDTIVDREGLEHVLLNLVANARAAMPRGGGATIATANAALGERDAAAYGCAPGDYVTLSVSDTGVGMSAQVREHLFERFFTTKAPGEGTGLGLATAHRFVTESGGAITVSSEPGLGTSVVAYLPRAASAVRAPALSRLVEEAPHGTGTILVVDDDDLVRRVTRSVLEDCGYEVVDARSGDVAVAELERRQGAVDLVLVDVVAPPMGGRDLVDQLEALGPVKVLFMSGHDDAVIEQHGVSLRRDALLRKAFTPSDLARKVREVLDG
jgi:signal transduction histidine kinase